MDVSPGRPWLARVRHKRLQGLISPSPVALGMYTAAMHRAAGLQVHRMCYFIIIAITTAFHHCHYIRPGDTSLPFNLHET